MSTKSTTLLSTSKGSNAVQSLSTKTPSRETQKLDARLKYISDKILPKSPYLLTVPSDRPYHVSSHQADDWRRGSPFSANEEQLQYLSFLSRDWNDGLLKAVGGWDNDKGEIMDATSKQLQAVRSGTSTPQQGQVQKKKISLSDYKNSKAAGHSGTKDTAKPNDEHNKLSNTDKSLAPTAEVKPEAHLQIHGQKRSAETIDDTKSVDPHAPRPDSQPLAKKLRTSPPPPKDTGEEATVGKSTKITLPPLLSPTLPPNIEQELAKIQNIPALGQGKTEHKKTTSITSTTSNKQLQSVQTSSPSASQALKISKANTSNPESKTSSAKKPIVAGEGTKQQEALARSLDAKPQNSSQATAEKSIKVNGVVGTNNLHHNSSNGARKSPATLGKPATNSTADPVEGKSKMVKLKIPKGRRKDVSRLLQMKPRPKKLNTANELAQNGKAAVTKSKVIERDQAARSDRDLQGERSKNNNDSGRQHNGNRNISAQDRQESSKPNEKRRRAEDDSKAAEPPSKRQKPPGSLDLSHKPRTPIPPAFKSPSLSQHGSAQKATAATPKREIKSAAMRRLESEDGEVQTPHRHAKASTPGAPNSVERVNREGRSVSNTSSITSSVSSKSDDVNAWRAESKKFMDLGRTLKHDADAFFKAKDMDAKTFALGEKRAIATAVETILSYMVAFTAADEGSRIARKPCDQSAWRSLIPYLNHVKSVTLGHTNLHGFCLQLEAVCRNNIQSLDLERLEKEALPTNPVEEAKPPTPGGDVDGVPHDASAKAAQHRKDYIEFKAKLVENARLAQQLWVEGAFELSVEDLQRSFPLTWKNNARAPVVRSKERLMIGKFAGDYYLPLSSVSSGIEAARAGWSLLDEWCKKENVDWEGKLGL